MPTNIPVPQTPAVPSASHATACPGQGKKRKFDEMCDFSSSAPAVLPGTQEKKTRLLSDNKRKGTLLSPISIPSTRATTPLSGRSSSPEIVEISAAEFEGGFTNPSYYDNLPYSRQDYFTSGLDQGVELEEESSEEFWGKVLKAWERSLRGESVEERREGFRRDGRRVWEDVFPKERREG